MTRYIPLIAAALLLATGAVASAQGYDKTYDVVTAKDLTLQAAKDKGLIGEMTNGLVGAVFSDADDATRQLVDITNKGRMAVYQEMAQKQRIDIDQIRSIAANKLYAQEKPGNYVQYNSQWTVKKN